MLWIGILIILAIFAHLADESYFTKRVSTFAQVFLILFLSYITAFYGTYAQDHANYVSRYNYIAGLRFSEAIGNLGFGKATEGTEFGYYLLKKYLILMIF